LQARFAPARRSYRNNLCHDRVFSSHMTVNTSY
jgi:hypothetical protein